MPFAARTPCLHPGCPDFAVFRGRCTDHAKKRDQERGSTTGRGYDAVWEKFRAWFIRRHPVCEDCGIAITTDVHHKIKLRDQPDLRLVESNCMGLCHVCHAVRTQRGE